MKINDGKDESIHHKQIDLEELNAKKENLSIKLDKLNSDVTYQTTELYKQISFLYKCI